MNTNNNDNPSSSPVTETPISIRIQSVNITPEDLEGFLTRNDFALFESAQENPLPQLLKGSKLNSAEKKLVDIVKKLSSFKTGAGPKGGKPKLAEHLWIGLGKLKNARLTESDQEKIRKRTNEQMRKLLN